MTGGGIPILGGGTVPLSGVTAGILSLGTALSLLRSPGFAGGTGVGLVAGGVGLVVGVVTGVVYQTSVRSKNSISLTLGDPEAASFCF